MPPWKTSDGVNSEMVDSRRRFYACFPFSVALFLCIQIVKELVISMRNSFSFTQNEMPICYLLTCFVETEIRHHQ